MFSFDELDPSTAVLVYALANLVITSVCPVPLGVFMIVAAGLMWGAVWGGAIYLSTCACGSAITFALARCMRPRLLARLGDKHRRTFNTLDAALVADGVMIAILWRVAPIAPFVLSSALHRARTATFLEPSGDETSMTHRELELQRLHRKAPPAPHQTVGPEPPSLGGLTSWARDASRQQSEQA